MHLYDALAGRLSKLATPIHRATDWFGTEYHVYAVGEETPESLMLTGGFRGDCRAAVEAVAEVVEEIEVSKRAFVAPTLDPTGFNGLGYIASRIGHTASREQCKGGAHQRALDIVRAGNLVLAYPVRETLPLQSLAEELGKCVDLGGLEGFYVALSRDSGEDSPVAVFHVEDASLLRLDEWRTMPPGHVGEALGLVLGVSPELYIELGCIEHGGEGVEIGYAGSTAGPLVDLVEIAAIQVEEGLGVAPKIVDLRPHLPAFHSSLVENGVSVVRVVAGAGYLEEALRLAALSLVNGFAFFSL